MLNNISFYKVVYSLLVFAFVFYCDIRNIIKRCCTDSFSGSKAMNSNLLAGVCALLLVTFDRTSGCGDGWILSERSQKCFYVSKELMAYRGAQAACENTPGQTLACVAYIEDVQALKQGTTLPIIDYWLDLYKENHNVIEDIDERRRQFSWKDGSPNTAWMKIFWAVQEPGPDERYGRLAANMSSFKGSRDDVLHGYICQIAAPSTSSSTMMTEVQSTPSRRSQSFATSTASDLDTHEVSSSKSTMEEAKEPDSMMYIAAGVGGGVGLVLIIIIIVVVVIIIRKRKQNVLKDAEPTVEYSYANEIKTSDLRYDGATYENMTMDYSTNQDLQPENNTQTGPRYPSYAEVEFAKSSGSFETHGDINRTNSQSGTVYAEVSFGNTVGTHSQNKQDNVNVMPVYAEVDKTKKHDDNVSQGMLDKEAEARRISAMYSKPIKR